MVLAIDDVHRNALAFQRAQALQRGGDLYDGLLDEYEPGMTRARLEPVLDVVGARTEVTELVGVRQPDLVLLNDEDLTFTKIRLDERSWTSRIRRDTITGHRPAEPECATGAAQHEENDPQ